MQIISKKPLHNFRQEHADSRKHLDSWEAEVEAAEWETPHDVKKRFPKVSIIGNLNAVFNICRDKYRLWVQIAYKTRKVFVKKIGTHKEYNKWDIK